MKTKGRVRRLPAKAGISMKTHILSELIGNVIENKGAWKMYQVPGFAVLASRLRWRVSGSGHGRGALPGTPSP